MTFSKHGPHRGDGASRITAQELRSTAAYRHLILPALLALGSGHHSPEADVAFGYRIPVYRFTDGTRGPVVDAGLEGGVLARFALGDGLGGLVNSDFRVAFPFSFVPEVVLQSKD